MPVPARRRDDIACEKAKGRETIFGGGNGGGYPAAAEGRAGDQKETPLPFSPRGSP